MLLLGGIAFQIIAYTTIFTAGIWFYFSSPCNIIKHKWLRIAFLCFYLWLPVDIYTITLDVKFALSFNPNEIITQELKDLFLSRQTTLGPIPLIQLMSYLFALWIVVFKVNRI